MSQDDVKPEEIGDASEKRPRTLSQLVGDRTLFHRVVVKYIHEKFVDRIKNGEQMYVYGLAVLVGLLMGVVCAAFRYLISVSHSFFFEASMLAVGSEGHHHIGMETPAQMLVRALLPALGGLLVGLVIYRILNLSGGHGVPSVMKAVATGNMNLAPGMAIKSASSVVTISSGGSVGPEGPIIEIGSVVGSLVGREGAVSKERVGTLVGAGAAAGIAGIFNAPIGGVFLALELLMRDFTVRTFGPVVIASVVASATSETILPNRPVFPKIPDHVLATVAPSWAQFAMFLLLGLITGVGGAVMVYTLYRAHDLFQKVHIPTWMKPGLGGLLVGLVGLAFPSVIGEGYEFVSAQVLEHYWHAENVPVIATAAAFFIFVAIVKIIATGLSLGSGGTGGAFAPAMVAGAAMGAGFGVLCNVVAPQWAPAIPIFAMVGMAGAVCSALNIPWAGFLIIYEISGADYRLVMPLMITVTMSAFMSTIFNMGSVYTLPLLRSGFDIEKALKRAANPLARVDVRKIMNQRFTRVRPNDNLDQMIDAFSMSDDDAFAVVDEEENLYGMISARDLRGVLQFAGVGQAIIAADAADTNPDVLYPDSPAAEAMTIFGNTEVSAIPVLARRGSRRVIGIVSRVDVLSAYRGAASN